jgi:hypothetical protein
VDKPSGNLSQNVHCGQFVGTHQVQQFFAISWNFTAVLKNKKYLKVEHGQNSICLFSVMKHFEEILSTVFERIFMGLLVGSFHTKYRGKSFQHFWKKIKSSAKICQPAVAFGPICQNMGCF